MERKQLKLTQVIENAANPRMITDIKLEKLIESILVFPRMMELRPIVVDETYNTLGGNMRLKALTQISAMTVEDIKGKLASQKVFTKKVQGEQDALVKYWEKWLKKPTATVVMEDTLTADEKKQFIIKDNVSFGSWDWNALGKWDTEDLGEWGMDVWTPAPTEWNDGGTTTHNTTTNNFDGGVLPPELQGTDITPDELPRIEGDGETAYERIIIVYPKDKADELAAHLGIEKIDKVVYNLEELAL